MRLPFFLSLLLLGFANGVAQPTPPDTVRCLLTVHADSLATRSVTHLPYTFAPTDPGEAFPNAFLRGIRSGRIRVWVDGGLQQPLSKRAVRQQLAPYRHWLRKRIPFRLQLPDPRNYYLAVTEIRLPGRAQPSSHAVQLFRWDSAAPPVRTWYVQCNNRHYRAALDAIRVYRDWTADALLPPSEALRRHLVNYRVEQGPEPTAALAPLPAVPASKRLLIRIPRALGPDNTVVDLPMRTDSLLRGNEALLQQAAGPLLRAALTRKIPLYYENVPRKLPKGQSARFISQHAAAVARADIPANARRYDYSFGIDGLEVGGLLVHDGATVRFEPDEIRIVWRDNEQDLPVSGIGVMRLRDADRLRLRVQGQPLRDFLAGLSFYYYPVRLNDYAPESIDAAFYLFHFLQPSNWPHMPQALEVNSMPPAELHRRTLQLYRSK